MANSPFYGIAGLYGRPMIKPLKERLAEEQARAQTYIASTQTKAQEHIAELQSNLGREKINAEQAMFGEQLAFSKEKFGYLKDIVPELLDSTQRFNMSDFLPSENVYQGLLKNYSKFIASEQAKRGLALGSGASSSAALQLSALVPQVQQGYLQAAAPYFSAQTQARTSLISSLLDALKT